MKKTFLFPALILFFLVSACSLSSQADATHDLALNEKNIDEVENLATFGTASESCVISSRLDSDIETRVINGQTQYFLTYKDHKSKNIQIWDLGIQKNTQTFSDIDTDAVLFNPDLKTLITFFGYYESNALSTWDIQSGNQQQSFTLDVTRFYDERINTSQDGSKIALFSCSNNAVNCRVSEFDLQTNQINDAYYEFPLYYETPPPRTYSPNGDLITVTYDKDDNLHFLNLPKQEDTVLQFPFKNREDVFMSEAIISTIAMSSNEKYLVGGGLNGDIYIWDTKNGILINSIEAHTPNRVDGWVGGIKILEFSPESNLILSVGYDGYTKLWNVATGELLKEIKTCHIFGGFTQDGRYLVTIGKNGIEKWGIP
jgi:WD40 repeat protein